MKQRVVVVVVVAFLSLLGCGGDPPGLVIALQVQEGAAALNTSNVTGLLVRIGQDEQSIAANREAQEAIELLTPPAGLTEIVVFACKGNAACRQEAAAFVGCTQADLQPSSEPLAVFVRIFDVATPPADCGAFLDPE